MHIIFNKMHFKLFFHCILQQASSGLNEKQATIEHLQDKLKMLEMTKSTSELPGDQQVQALIQQVQQEN